MAILPAAEGGHPLPPSARGIDEAKEAGGPTLPYGTEKWDCTIGLHSRSTLHIFVRSVTLRPR